MVKYLAIAAALMASLMIAEQAQARGRRGCSSCGGYVANGCSGGSCYAPAAPGKYSSIDNAPPGLASAPVADTAPVVVAQPATTNYYNASAPRRGLFGRR